MDRIDNYHVYEGIGRGGFAVVHRGVAKATGRQVAIKMIDKKQMNASGMAKRVREEVSIHSRLKHPAILELFSFFEDDNFVYLILEFCEEGELASYLKRHCTPFSEAEARSIVEQVKIGDFGLATQIRSAQERHVTMCGTPNFISPEVATRSAHGLEADIWGLGCLLYTMLVGIPPFDTSGVKSTLTKVVMSDYTLPESLTYEAKDLINAMLRKNPMERIKLQDIMSHPWMRIGNPSLSSHHQQYQDSGMFTMTTGFSTKVSVASTTRPEHKPMLMRPVAENPGRRPPAFGQHIQQAYPAMMNQVKSEPVLAYHPGRTDPPPAGSSWHNRIIQSEREEYSSSPPVRMRTDPKDLPAPALLPSRMGTAGPGVQPLVAGQGSSGTPALTRSNSIPRMQSSQQMYRSNEHISHLSDPREGGSRQFDNPVSKSRGSFHEYQFSNHHNQPQPSQDYQTNRFDYNQVTRDNNFNRQNSNYDKQNNERPGSANANNKRIEDVVQPLSTIRLRPIRQKTKNAVANILASGEVCLEFIAKKRGKEKIQDVMRISEDGQRVVVYNLGKEGASIMDTPTPIPAAGADAFYNYGSLPEKLWKKYIYASRFVNLVKAKTPKITLYDSKSKSYLMENSPDPDFETYFNNGVKISYTDKTVKFIDSQGTNHTFSYPIDKSMVPPACQYYLDHFQSCEAHCKRLERLLSEDVSPSPYSNAATNLPVFPAIIGRKPTKDDKLSKDEATNNSLEKENKAPAINNLRSFQGTILSEAVGTTAQMGGVSTSQQQQQQCEALLARLGAGYPPLPHPGGHHQSRSVRSDMSRTMQIPGIGVASLRRDGTLQVDYDDGSAIRLRTGTSSLDYLSPPDLTGQHSGAWTSYSHHNLPVVVKQKLSHIPQILQQLSKPVH